MSPHAAVQTLLIAAAPALMIALARRYRVAKAIGPVVLCYAGGIVCANVPFFRFDGDLSTRAAEVAVPLAVPLLLLPTQLRVFRSQARSTLFAFALACFASAASALLVGTALVGEVPRVEAVAGMLVGTYIGGTVNLNAIGLALQVPRELLVGVNAADMVTGGILLMFLLTAAHPFLRRILPPHPENALLPEGAAPHPADEESAQGEGPPWPGLLPSLAALGVGVVIVAVSAGGVLLVFGKLETVPVLLALTTLGLGASLIRPLRELRAAPVVGEYALFAFCFSVGALVDVKLLVGTSPALLGVTTVILLLAMALHVALGRLFRVDADTLLITSTAAIFGPPFVPAVARAIGNRGLIAGGVACGLLGLALGTYLGLAAAWLLTG